MKLSVGVIPRQDDSHGHTRLKDTNFGSIYIIIRQVPQGEESLEEGPYPYKYDRLGRLRLVIREA
jgi:hypothetical protein